MVNKTRTALLTAATKLIYKKGYWNTSIREIGTKAGVSNAALYYHFKDKEEVLFQIISDASQDLLAALKEIDGRVKDPKERLREMILLQTAVHVIKNLMLSKIVVEENYWLTGKRKEVIKDLQRQIHALYMKSLKELAVKNQMRDVDRTVLSFSIFGIINWFFRWYKEKGRLSPEEIADNIVDLLFHGMLKTETRL